MKLWSTSEAIRFIIYALATYRIVWLLWRENGPGDIFDLIRYKVGIRWVNDQGWVATTGGVGRVLNCAHCLSGWVALLMLGAMLARINLLDLFALWLALWAVSRILFDIFAEESE